MKYQKGSRVEVLRSRERPGGCWRLGEIIGGNGRFYIVQFDGIVCCRSSKIVQRVLPGSIRPCPPAVKVPQLRRGDIVEVLIGFAWQTATVWKVMKKRYIWVTCGACEKIRVKKGDFRIKQAWQNDEWAVVKQRSYTSVHGKTTSTINFICESKSIQTNGQNNQKASDGEAAAKKTNNRTHEARLKRKSTYVYNPEPCLEVTEKFRAIEKDGLVFRAPAVTLSPTAVDPGLRYPLKETQEEAPTCSFWRKVWFPGVNSVKENQFGTDKTLSSVGSCGITSSGIHISHRLRHKPKHSEEYNSYVSDAESSCGRGSEENIHLRSTKNAISAEVQR
ncbi:unnamed protein product [Rhodiola kirilowii]